MYRTKSFGPISPESIRPFVGFCVRHLSTQTSKIFFDKLFSLSYDESVVFYDKIADDIYAWIDPSDYVEQI